MRLRLSFAFSILLLGVAGLWVGLHSAPGWGTQNRELARALRSPTTEPTPETKRFLKAEKKADAASYVHRHGRRIVAKGWVSVSPPQHNVDPGKPAGEMGEYGYALHAGGKVYELTVEQAARMLPVSSGASPGSEPAFEAGSVIRVSGTRTQTGINVTRSALAGAPLPSHALAPAPTRRGLREYRVAIIRFHYQDQADTPASQAAIQTTLDQVRDFYLQASSGDFLLQFGFSNEVAVDLPIPSKAADDCSVYPGSQAAQQIVRDQGFDTDAYDQLAFVFEMGKTCPSAAGAANFRESYYYNQGGTDAERAAGPSRFAFSHEIGHCLGFAHANAAKATFLGAPVPISRTWTNAEYGDEADVMGTGWEKTFDAPHRAKIGFLPLDRTADVTPQPAATAQAIPLAAVDGALPAPGGTKQLLRIRRTSVADPQADNAYLYLDLRANDPRGTYDQFKPNDPRVNGVTVRFGPSYGAREANFRVLNSSPGRRNAGSEGNERSTVLDPSLRSPAGEQDYSVAVGQSMWDPQEDLTITTESITGGVASVKVTQGGPSGAATTANVLGDRLYINAGDDRRNNVVVSENEGKITVVDDGNVLTAQTGCDQVNVQTVTCTKTGVKAISMKLDTAADATAGRTIKDVGAVFGSLAMPVTFDGGPGQDSLEGGPGDDTFYAGPGGSDGSDADIFAGGGGNDVVSYAGRTEAVNVSSITSPQGFPYFEWENLLFNDGGPGEGDQVRNDIGGVIGGSGPDTLAPNPELVMNLTGGAGSDTLTGGIRKDTLNVRDGAATDTLACGGGSDAIYSDGGDSLNTDCGAPAPLPLVKLSIGPAEGSSISEATPTFAWSAANATGITYTCKLENGTSPGAAPMGACNNAYSYIPATTLTEGPKVFSLVGTLGGVPTTIVRKFTVDRTAPTTTLVAKPAATSDASASNFTLSSSDAASDARFACSLDEAPFDAPVFTSCDSSVHYADLKPGNYRFSARAVDLAGNVDPNPVSWDWTVSPDTIFDARTSRDFNFVDRWVDDQGGVHPEINELRNERPQFAFHSTSDTAAFWCKVDDAAFAPCTSPWRPAVLDLNQNHRVVISAGTATAPTDPTPWDVTFTANIGRGVETLLSDGPSEGGATTSSTPTFTFKAWSRAYWGPYANIIDSLVRYRCSIDAAVAVACDSGSFTTPPLAEGQHTFAVYALTDDGQQLERDWTPATRTFAVDTTAPTARFDSGPAEGEGVTAKFVSYAFSAPGEPTATFECKLDSGAWSACTSPRSVSTGAYGAHTFSVRPTDAAGNVGAVITRGFTMTAPDTAFTGGPAAASTTNAAPTFTFAATPATGATFECSVTASLTATWSPCTSPWSPGPQPETARIFQVRAKSAAGVYDPSPAVRLLWFDYTAPDTVVDSGPADGSTLTTDSTSFAFSAPSEASATFECKLDAAAWAACTSPTSLTALTNGSHAFRVRSSDDVGNVDQSEAVRNFTVAVPAPETAFTGGPAAGAYVNGAAPTFTFEATPSAGATFECSIAAGTWSACTSPWTVPAQSAGSRQFQVRAKGPSGPTDPTPDSRTVTFDFTAPTSTSSSGPAAGSTITTASTSFGFAVTGEAAGAVPTSLECKLDAGTWAACTSPKALADLPNGSHTFAVQGRDAAGNVGPTISRAFTVAQPKVLTVAAPATSPAAASLSTDPTLGTAKDWVHWKGNTPAALDRKTGSPQISTWAPIITTQPVNGLTGTTTFSWTDAAAGGAAGSPSTTGVYTGSANGRGFRITIPATSPQTRTLKLWVGARGASTTDAVKAYFTDKVASQVNVSSTSNTTTIDRVFTIPFRPSKATDTLTVEWWQGGGATNANSRAILYAAAVY